MQRSLDYPRMRFDSTHDVGRYDHIYESTGYC